MVYIPLVITLVANAETCWLPVDGQAGSADDCERGGLGSIPADGIFSAGGGVQRAATTAIVVRSLFFLVRSRVFSSLTLLCLLCFILQDLTNTAAAAAGAAGATKRKNKAVNEHELIGVLYNTGPRRSLPTPVTASTLP